MSRNIQYTILILSVLIPLIVAFLLFIPEKVSISGDWNSMLPHVNGSLNTITSLLLVFGFLMIKRKNKEMHKRAMSLAFMLGVLFLISYLIYHSTAVSTVFGDLDKDGILSEQEATMVEGSRMVYLIILLTHILLAIIVVPFVLFAFYYALTEKIDKHKKIVRFTLPIWLYVSITGVVVYLLIKPYY